MLGEITDTNTPFMANQLAMLGIDLYHASTVGDNCERLLGALNQAWQRSDLIITTGGLGPTQDDVTREGIAQLLGESAQVDAGLKKTLIDAFLQRGLEMPESNIKQATLIPSATAIPNPRGTAPGWWVEKEGRVIAALPGPPSEMQPMWRNEIFPKLERKSGAIILHRTVKTFGLGESAVEEMVASFISDTNPTVATYAKSDGIHLRITAKAAEREAAYKLITKKETKIREVLGHYIWGVDDDTLEGVVGQIISSKGLTLAVAESLTGGFLSHALAGAPGSDRYFKGGITVVSDAAMTAFGIEPGLLSGGASDEIATKMASLARSKFAADIGIGIDGYNEPASDIQISKVFIAIEGGRGGQSTLQSYAERTHSVARRATQHVLFNLRSLLISQGN